MTIVLWTPGKNHSRNFLDAFLLGPQSIFESGSVCKPTHLGKEAREGSSSPSLAGSRKLLRCPDVAHEEVSDETIMASTPFGSNFWSPENVPAGVLFQMTRHVPHLH